MKPSPILCLLFVYVLLSSSLIHAQKITITLSPVALHEDVPPQFKQYQNWAESQLQKIIHSQAPYMALKHGYNQEKYLLAVQIENFRFFYPLDKQAVLAKITIRALLYDLEKQKETFRTTLCAHVAASSKEEKKLFQKSWQQVSHYLAWKTMKHLPLEGKVIERFREKVTINCGYLLGVTKGDVFHVLDQEGKRNYRLVVKNKVETKETCDSVVDWAAPNTPELIPEGSKVQLKIAHSIPDEQEQRRQALQRFPDTQQHSYYLLLLGAVLVLAVGGWVITRNFNFTPEEQQSVPSALAETSEPEEETEQTPSTVAVQTTKTPSQPVEQPTAPEPIEDPPAPEPMYALIIQPPLATCYLEISSPQKNCNIYLLTKPKLLLGRSGSSCDIQVNYITEEGTLDREITRMVSACHCQITYQNSELIVEHLKDTKNPTLVNSLQQVGPEDSCELKNGDIIELGPIQLKLNIWLDESETSIAAYHLCYFNNPHHPDAYTAVYQAAAFGAADNIPITLPGDLPARVGRFVYAKDCLWVQCLEENFDAFYIGKKRAKSQVLYPLYQGMVISLGETTLKVEIDE